MPNMVVCSLCLLPNSKQLSFPSIVSFAVDLADIKLLGRPMMIYNDIEHDTGNANKASRGVEPIKKKMVEILVKITALTFIR